MFTNLPRLLLGVALSLPAPTLGIKKCLPIPNSALSPTCLSLALTPTTACLDNAVDFSDRDSSTLALAKLSR